MSARPTVDVAVQSYMKPELLLRSLLSLKRHSADYIDSVWINDDQSDGWVIAAYRSPEFTQALAPWKIRIRQNNCRVGWWYRPVHDLRPRHMPVRRRLRHWWKGIRNPDFSAVQRQDIRYQWALDETDKKFVFIILVFHADVLGVYLKAIADLRRPSVVGELGQCWRCEWAKQGCTPEQVVRGSLPSVEWPSTPRDAGDPWPCRINEWSALMSVDAAHEIEAKCGILFGNYDNKGDVGAYWFAAAHQEGFQFTDPLANASRRMAFYSHGDGGSGHSVWVDQGKGKRKYCRNEVIQSLSEEYGFLWPSQYAPVSIAESVPHKSQCSAMGGGGDPHKAAQQNNGGL